MPRVRSPEEEAARQAKREAKRKANRVIRAERKARERADPVIVAARLKARQHRDDHNARMESIKKEVLGASRQFVGDLLLSEAAQLSDGDMLLEMGGSALGGVGGGSAAVYWTDGASLNLNPGVVGSANYLGAGVVWMERDPRSARLEWRSNECMLGCNTGSIGDAELYAITAAMGLAIDEIEKGNEAIQCVRILTDRLGLLQGIPLNRVPLGPFVSTRLAIQELYERAEWLVAKGIKVELAWVRGHAKSMGNKEADRAATRAAKTQARESLALVNEAEYEPKLATAAPKIFEERGAVWRDEWLWRANKSLLIRSGKAVAGLEDEGEVVAGDLDQDVLDDVEMEIEANESKLDLEEESPTSLTEGSTLNPINT
jgi:ribonuclease HI